MPTLSRYEKEMKRAMEATMDVADLLRDFRDSTGDLPLQRIERIEQALSKAKESTVSALKEGQKRPDESEAFMRAEGGPDTLTALEDGLKVVEISAAAWNAAVDAMYPNLVWSDLIERTTTAVGTKVTNHKMLIPSALADTLRQSTALQDLIAAFEAVGAK